MVYSAGDLDNRNIYFSGVIVSPDGLVVMAPPMGTTLIDPNKCLAVQTVPGDPAYPAEIVRVDPIWGAVLLRFETSDAPFAELGRSAALVEGDRVSAYSTSRRLWAEVAEGSVHTGIDEGDTYFAMASNGGGIIVFEGKVVGVEALPSWGGWAPPTRSGSSGPPPAFTRVVAAEYLKKLVEDRLPFSAAELPLLASHKAADGRQYALESIDGRQALHEVVIEKLHSLGPPVEMDFKDGRLSQIMREATGPQLEFVYAGQPLLLRSRDGETVEQANYVVFYWDRGDGLPDIVIPGLGDTNHIASAYEAGDLTEIKAALETAKADAVQWPRGY